MSCVNVQWKRAIIFIVIVTVVVVVVVIYQVVILRLRESDLLNVTGNQ